MGLVGSIASRWKAAARRLAVVVLASTLAVSCASNPNDTTNDPLEGFNRHMFAINGAVDTMLIKPSAIIYREIVPRPIKSMVSNFLDHLTLPLTMIHDLLQGKPERAQVAFGRFFLNTIVGMGGVFDVATPSGFVLHKEDMGQTLATHGVGPGPYLVLPLLGPSSVRDASGTVIDFFIDPMGIAAYGLPNGRRTVAVVKASVNGVVQREKLIEPLDALKDSLDYYATIRNAYRQRRAIDIRDGAPDPAATQKADPFAEFEVNDKKASKNATQ